MTPLLVQISLARGFNPSLPARLLLCRQYGCCRHDHRQPAEHDRRPGVASFLSRFPQDRRHTGAAVAADRLVDRPSSIAADGILLAPSNRAVSGTGRDAHKRETIKAAVVTFGVCRLHVHRLAARAGGACGCRPAAPQSPHRIGRHDEACRRQSAADADGAFHRQRRPGPTGTPQQLLAELRSMGLDTHAPVWLFVITSILCNLVGNNPAVMLLVPYLDPRRRSQRHRRGARAGHRLFLQPDPVRQPRRHHRGRAGGGRGVKISFGEFARAGVPVALACMALALGWLMAIT